MRTMVAEDIIDFSAPKPVVVPKPVVPIPEPLPTPLPTPISSPVLDIHDDLHISDSDSMELDFETILNEKFITTDQDMPSENNRLTYPFLLLRVV
jgi:hypothetical protein